MKTVFCIALLSFSIKMFAQNITTVTPQEQAFYDKAMPAIKKEYKNLVLQTAGQLKGRNINSDSLIRMMKGNKILGDLNDGDIEGLVFLVLMEASKSAQDDLKTVMGQTKAINKSKESLRNLNQPIVVTKKDSSMKLIRNKQLVVQTKKDSLNEMDQTTQLRLQMTMDRRNKIMTSLSNIMKKISDTQDQIIHNLK